MPRPDFIIIGAMKCATSTLHAQLARQRGIFMSEPKEPNFFSDDEQYTRGIVWYQSLFAGAAPGDLCGESSTHYTKLPDHPKAVERMWRALGSDVRLIYIMRHPIERLVSQYVHEWTQRVIHCDIDKAIDELPALVHYSCYGMQVGPYLDRFGEASVLPVFVERLHDSPQRELERVCDFVGYTGEPRWNNAIEPQNVSAQRLRRSVFRSVLIDLPIFAGLRRRFVPIAVRERIKRRWRLESRPVLAEASQARLKKIFDEDLRRLAEWCGLELTCDTWRQRVLAADPPSRGSTARQERMA